MKLKFEPEVQQVVNAIAALPDEVFTNTALWEPHRIIGEFSNHLKGLKNNKEYPTKQWAKLRRQLSFLYALLHLATTADATNQAMAIVFRNAQLLKNSTVAPSEDLSKVNVYRYFVKLVKELNNGKALEDLYRVRMAANFGLLYLSDQEIEGLIERNKV